MTIIYRVGRFYCNVDVMFRIFDRLERCNCFEVGVDFSFLLCGGCKFCVRVYYQWIRFYEDVDDVISLVVR